MSFERKVIFEDTRLRDLSNRQAKEKLELLNKAIEWCKIKGVKLETKKEKEEFKIDFVEFFKKKFYSINGTKTGLPLNVNKLMDLLDINILELQRILEITEVYKAILEILEITRTLQKASSHAHPT